MKRQKDELKLIAYCGLYCGLCAERARIPEQAQALRETMAEEGYEYWGTDLPAFKEFWFFLNNLCDAEKTCLGCRSNGGPPFCGIRKCAREREVEICVFCEEYPCSRIRMLEVGYPMLVKDGLRMRELGESKWVREQEKRVKTGFAYADIRCRPYKVPRD